MIITVHVEGTETQVRYAMHDYGLPYIIGCVNEVMTLDEARKIQTFMDCVPGLANR